MTATPPPWLCLFQKRFSAMLRTPLDPSNGTFRAVETSYGSDLRNEVQGGETLKASKQLAIYNKQYWFRLFGALQGEFPLTARLLGFWEFNHWAQRFLLLNPPGGYDLAMAADGFAAFLCESIVYDKPLPRAALFKAVKIDEAWRMVFSLPPQEVWVPAAAELEQFAKLRLKPSAALVFIEEAWPLMTLRSQLAKIPGEARIPLPPQLVKPQHWALIRSQVGIGQVPLAPLQARFYNLLTIHPLETALTNLEQDSSEEERQHLAHNVQNWLAQSIQLAFWSGSDFVLPHP